MRTKFIKILAIVMALMLLGGCAGQDSGGQYSLYVCSANEGSVICSVDGAESVADGQPVTVSATANEGYTFVGWSKGGYLEDYGELVSEDAQYTFTKNGRTRYYANFVGENQVLVCYHANGGTINDAASRNGVLIQKLTMQNHQYPMTLPQNGTISREGYVLTEYASQPDGSGTVTNIGQRAFDDNKIVHLYAQWSRETDIAAFTFQEVEDYYYVSNYVGTDTVITIPSAFNGKPVKGVASNAISSGTLKTLIIPKSVTTLQTNAFAGCSSLTTVYLYDSVVEMTDGSFAGCPIQKVCLNSVYDQYYYAQGVGKLELLYSQKNTDINRLVVLSGSSSTMGLDSQHLQNNLTKQYSVVNFALQIAIPGSFTMRLIENYLQAGDVVLWAPECELKQFNNALTTMAFVKFDGAFTAFRNVDIREFRYFFDSMAMYALAKAYDTENLDIAQKQFYHAYGDEGNQHTQQDFASNYQFKSPTERTEMTDTVYQRINAAIDSLKNRGVTVYLSFAPFSTEACAGTVTDAMMDTYSTTLAQKLHAVCIASQSDHNYAKKYFYEMFHMTAEGKQVRTERLIAELNAQFAKEG